VAFKNAFLAGMESDETFQRRAEAVMLKHAVLMPQGDKESVLQSLTTEQDNSPFAGATEAWRQKACAMLTSDGTDNKLDASASRPDGASVVSCADPASLLAV
jgi:hypothetical protein